jgi:hypothetical protein
MSSRKLMIADPTLEMADEQPERTSVLFQQIAAADGRAGRIQQIALGSIRPDPRQPRRQIPSLIRAEWGQGYMESLWEIWLRHYAQENRLSYDQAVGGLLDRLNRVQTDADSVYQDEPVRNKTEAFGGTISKSLHAVVDLAAEIRADGLINPIRIVKDGEGYLIESGERRWLAYNFLWWINGGDEAWGKIPAQVAPQFSAWQQARENTARSQLNAIQMARQFALLLMDLYTAEGVSFLPFDDMVEPGGCDRAFYAQVADGALYRVPRGQGEVLIGALGLKNPAQLRQYRALLDLPDEVWTIADDLDWAEHYIRDMDKAAHNSMHFARLAALKASQEGYTVTTVTVSAENEVQEQSEGAIYDAAAEAAFRDIIGEPHPADEGWDGIALDPETGEATDAWTGQPLHQPQPPVTPTRPSAFERASATVVTTPSSPRISQVDWEKEAQSQRPKLLGAAYGKLNSGWFNAKRIGAHPEVLQVLARQGLFDTRPSRFNASDRSMDEYQITDLGRAEVRAMVVSDVKRQGGLVDELPASAPRPPRDAALITRSVASMFDGLQALRMSDLHADEADRQEIASAVRRFIDEMERLYNRVLDGQ